MVDTAVVQSYGGGDVSARSAGSERASAEAATTEAVDAMAAAPSSDAPVVVQATSGAASALPLPAVSLPLSSSAPRRSLTAWRLPSTPGKMPRYVKRTFRTKTFLLMSLQFLIVIAIQISIDVAFLGGWLDGGDGGVALNEVLVAMVWIGILDVVAICTLNYYMFDYPANFICLSVVTVLSGPFWALSGVVFSQGVFQHMTLGILCVACFVGASLSLMLSSTTRMADSTFVAFCFVVSWLVGTVCAAGAAWYLKCPWEWTALAAGTTLILFLVAYKDVSILLVECEPDNFMKVIVAMNSALLVIVSVPALLAVVCIPSPVRSQEDGEAGGVGGAQREAWDENFAAMAVVVEGAGLI